MNVLHDCVFNMTVCYMTVSSTWQSTTWLCYMTASATPGPLLRHDHPQAIACLCCEETAYVCCEAATSDVHWCLPVLLQKRQAAQCWFKWGGCV